jgi:phasin family protein
MTDQTLPFADVTAMMAKFQMPGVDMSAIVEARRKDIEALIDANAATVEGMQALARKQTEMLVDAMQGMQDATKSLVGGAGAPPDMARQGEVLRKGFETTLANMKELADMARHAQSDALARITQRAAVQLQDVRAMVTPKT